MIQHTSLPVYIETAQVTAVHKGLFQVDVITLRTKRVLRNITYAVPSVNPLHGTGINFSPSTGSLCWVMLNSSDPGTPNMDRIGQVIAWQPPRSAGSHAANRKELDQDDICLSSPGGGEVLIRSGGLVEVRGGHLARTMYIPITNTIKNLCQNFELDTFGGTFHWNTYTGETGDLGSSEFLVGIKELSSDENALVKISAGHSSGGIEFSVFDSGGSAQNLSCYWGISKSGEVTLTAKAGISISSDTNINMVSPEISLAATENMEFSVGDTKVSLRSNGITLNGPSVSISVSSLIITNSDGVPLLNLSPGQIPVLNANLLPFILTHTHPPAGGPPNESANIVQSDVTAKSTGIA